MENDIKNLKLLLEELKNKGFKEDFIKSLENCIERIEETLCLDTIELD